MKELLFKYLDQHYITKNNWLYHFNGRICRSSEGVLREIHVVLDIPYREVMLYITEWFKIQNPEFNELYFLDTKRPADSVPLNCWIYGTNPSKKIGWVTLEEFRNIRIQYHKTLKTYILNGLAYFYNSCMFIEVDGNSSKYYANTSDIRDMIRTMDTMSKIFEYD